MDGLLLIKEIKEIYKKFDLKKLEALEIYGIKGLVSSHGDILMSLFKSGPLPMSELAKRVGKDKSTITNLVGKLVKLNYVEKYKDEKDSRVVMVRLTEYAHEKRPIFLEITKTMSERITRHLEPEEIAIAIKVLDKINQGL